MVKHVQHFEVLRGAAALWVFASHVLLIVDRAVPYLSKGDQAVEVFVILSGFVIGLLCLKKDETYGRYVFRRWMRLYPLFLVALVFGGLTAYLYAPVFGGSPWLTTARDVFLTRDANAANFFWEHVLLHLTMLHGVVPDTILPQAALMFSGPLWSISLEWQFYLFAPFLVALISFASWRAAAISFGALVIAILLQRVTSLYWVGEVASFLPLRLPLFIVGIMSAVLWDRARRTPPLRLACAVLPAMVIVWTFAPNKLPILLWFATYYLAATHDRLAVSRVASWFVSMPASRFIGRISYGIYVLHVPTMMIIANYIVFPLAREQSAFVGALLIGAITLPIVILMAYLSFRFIEAPAMAWAKRRSTSEVKQAVTATG